jgi:hypothetical protein
MSNEEMALRAQNGEKGLILALWEQNIKFFRAKSYGMYMHNRGLCASSRLAGPRRRARGIAQRLREPRHR